MKCHKIPLTLNCTVAKPLKLPTIPFKTRNICQFRSFKCKKIGKIFLGTFSKYLLKIGDYRRCMHKIPLTPNCTVAKPLKLPTIPFKTRKICQFRSLKCKKIWKIFLGTSSKYLLKIGDYLRFMHKIPLTPNCTVAKPLKLPTIPFKTRKICQFRSKKWKKI